MPRGVSKNNKPSSLEALIRLTQADMAEVNRLILNMASARTDLIPQISNYLVNSGGKRLRPMLTIASARMFGYPSLPTSDKYAHSKLATAVEFMHTATLLHDDVVDNSDMRRGRATARKVWGNQASILVGDFLLGQAFGLMVDVGSLEALQVLSKAACVIAEGEVMQLASSKSPEISEEEYFTIINSKTAELFAAATSVGAIIAGCDDVAIEAMKIYGQKLGIAFQLVDDILDYNGNADDLGKNIGDDFRDGKITLPVILCLEKSDANERLFWYNAMCEGKNSEEDLQEAIRLLKKSNALERSIAYAKEYGKQACIALQSVKPVMDQDIREALLNIVDFCIMRVT